MKTKYKYIIIGAGLSGLVTGYELLKAGEEDFIILEAQPNVGGRIFTKDTIDFGATWLQSYHTTLLNLLEELGLKTFDQYSKGQSVLVYNSMSPAHYFEMDKNQPASKRIVGGTEALILALYDKVQQKVFLQEHVVSFEEQQDAVSIKTKTNNYKSDKVIVTLPPLLASEIEFKPELPLEVVKAMEGTHTWMSNAIKVGIQFEKPFWKARGFSGTVIGQASPVIELYDHTNEENTAFSLMGFVNESLRELNEDDRRERIISFLEKYLGEEIKDYVSYSEKDWSVDRYTSGERLKSYYLSPQYGNPVFQEFYFNSKLLFSGTETAMSYGGYLEGAVLSGLNACKKITNAS